MRLRPGLLLSAVLAVAPVSLPAQVTAPPSTPAPSPALGLIPEPREGRIVGNVPLRGLVVTQVSAPEDRFAAEDLLATLRERGVPAGVSGRTRVRLLRAGDGAARIALRQAKLDFTPALREEGYVLLARGGAVDVIGQSAAGVFYGVQTLKQLVEGSGASTRLREAVIRDWPAMRWRAWQDDMSRGPVPTMEFLKKQIRIMASFKANAISPYWEQTLAYPDHPIVAPPGGGISPDQAREIVAYAQRYHMTVIPEQEAFGHLHHVLKYELYSSLGETPNGHVLAPGDTGSLPFIRSMFSHIDSIFPGPFVHIGADETDELGRGRTAEEVRAAGLNKVYLDFVKQVEETLRPGGRKLLFWGDIAVGAPELVKTLPRSLVPVVWRYDSAASYVRSIKPFTDAGLETWVAPGVNAWNRVWPDFGIGLFDIRDLTRDGQALGAVGQLNTSWDDDGETLFNSTWYALLFGAAAAWQPAPASIEDFQQNYGRIFHGDTTGRIDEAQRKLIAAHALLRAHHGATSIRNASDWLFWADPWNGEGIAASQVVLPVAPQLRVLAEQALRLVLEVEETSPREMDALRALELGARRIDLIGQKFLFADQVLRSYAEAHRLATDTSAQHEDPDRNLWDISSMNGRLQDLRDSYSLLRDLYEEAWLRENRPYWLHNVLARYDLATQLWIQRADRITDAAKTLDRTGRLPAAWEVGLPTATEPAPAASNPGP